MSSVGGSESTVSTGFVYVLTNDAMPGLVKVGMTTRLPRDRADELSSATGVPVSFEVLYCQQVVDCHEAERLVHSQLAPYRVSGDREFFRLSTLEAVNCADMVIATSALSPFTGSPVSPRVHRGDGRVGIGWFECPTCALSTQVLRTGSWCTAGHAVRPGDRSRMMERHVVTCSSCSVDMALTDGRGICVHGHGASIFPRWSVI
jgi:hypothetical protein